MRGYSGKNVEERHTLPYLCLRTNLPTPAHLPASLREVIKKGLRRRLLPAHQRIGQGCEASLKCEKHDD